MFWADRIAADIEASRGNKKNPVIIRDEKTPSGRVHVGSMRGVAIHGIISDALAERGIENTFLYEFNDMDPMDGFPVYLPEEFKQYMGFPLFKIPSPDGKAKNYAEYFAEQFREVIRESGFTPTFYNVSELYLSGKMDESIRIALEHAEDIRRIYREVSGSKKSDDWYPLNVICENCGRVGTTKVTGFDGERVSYRCEEELVTWAKGCGHTGSISPFGGNATFPFKVEWPAKWKVIGVDLEGAGKDHATKGGAMDVADAIAREVFKLEPPTHFSYEFFLVGGKKMSSSKGAGSSARDVADLVPPTIFRLALLSKDIKQAFNFEPDGETIPTLFDLYDSLAEKYFAGEKNDQTRLFELIHTKDARASLSPIFVLRFSLVSFLVQMPHLSLEQEAETLKGAPLTEPEKASLMERASYARTWLKEHAPEKYRYELQEATVPEAARSLSDAQKQAVRTTLSYIEENENLTGEALHAKLHEIKESQGIEPKDLFSAFYLAFLGKPSGPKAGWFLSVLPRDFVISRLKEIVA